MEIATSIIQSLPLSLCEAGRVFVVGDVHGCFDLVQRALDRVNLDPATDSVFFIGDLIDRGPDSARCVHLLREPWAYGILGNHEDMLLRAQHDDEWAGHFIVNGGSWWLDTPPSAQADILDLIGILPVAIEMATPRGLVGFVHADIPPAMDWPTFTGLLRAGDKRVRETALWGRKRISDNNDAGIPGVGRVFVGHTPTTPRRLGNVYALDSGAVFGFMNSAKMGHLSMVNLLCKTQVFSEQQVDAAEHGLVRIIDDETLAPFGQYVRPSAK